MSTIQKPLARSYRAYIFFRQEIMKNEKKWETKSLEWIHKVREEIDAEIKEKGMTPA